MQCHNNNDNCILFLQLLSGPESQILESDQPITRAPAVLILPSGPRLRTAPKFQSLATSQALCYIAKQRKM